MIDRMVREWCKIASEPSQFHWDADMRFCMRLIHYFYTGQLLAAF